MNRFRECLHQLSNLNLAFALLPFAAVSTVLATIAPSVRADQIRVCERYGVVRDRSDHEVPLLPRRSIAYCARAYQTLYQSERVLQGSPDVRGDSNTERPSAQSQVENSPHSATEAPAPTPTPQSDRFGNAAPPNSLSLQSQHE